MSIFPDISQVRTRRIARIDPADVERGSAKAKRTRSGDAAIVAFCESEFIIRGLSLYANRRKMNEGHVSPGTAYYRESHIHHQD